MNAGVKVYSLDRRPSAHNLQLNPFVPWENNPTDRAMRQGTGPSEDRGPAGFTEHDQSYRVYKTGDR